MRRGEWGARTKSEGKARHTVSGRKTRVGGKVLGKLVISCVSGRRPQRSAIKKMFGGPKKKVFPFQVTNGNTEKESQEGTASDCTGVEKS